VRDSEKYLNEVLDIVFGRECSGGPAQGVLHGKQTNIARNDLLATEPLAPYVDAYLTGRELRGAPFSNCTCYIALLCSGFLQTLQLCSPVRRFRPARTAIPEVTAHSFKLRIGVAM
jgi:hypothetical protein